VTAEQLPRISVIDPISPAIERVKLILFKPFELGKWFVIGFCAWLAYLGSGGGAGAPNPNLPRRYRQHYYEPLQQAKEFIVDNLSWLVPAAIIGLTLMIAIWLVFIWLSSRGRFMFLHCVARNKAEVKIPWTEFRRHANSLLLFRIVLGIIMFFVTALLCLPIVLLVIVMTKADIGQDLAAVFGFIMLGLTVFVVSILFLLVHKFTTDFVVPIMFLQTISCTAAWRKFWALLSANKGRFALYILFQIVIAIAICAILMTAACITCCCAACILAIPYIGTVVMLPLLVFKRAYSLLYLGQFGPSFDCFAPSV